MNLYQVSVIFLLAVLVHQSVQQTTACNATTCVNPGCRCMSTERPNLSITPANTPQIVVLSFDGGVTTNQINNYTNILSNRVNPNGCPITATFFVYHEYNDYTLTHKLYTLGQELATFSMSHSLPSTSWANKPVNTWVDEIGGMKSAMAQFSNIPASAIRGARAPFLQTSGDNTFQAMRQVAGMLYDASFPTNRADPPIWPYTADFGIQHDCQIPPCPRNSYPGLWTVPMVSLLDLNNTKQSMADGFPTNSRNETYQYLLRNFENHYRSNKAPFGIYLNANAWFNQLETAYRLEGYLEFLDYLSRFDDVYVVSVGKLVDYMRNPVSVGAAGAQGGPFACPTISPPSCTPRRCYYDDTPLGSERQFQSCTACPEYYPWTGNPLGQNPN